MSTTIEHVKDFIEPAQRAAQERKPEAFSDDQKVARAKSAFIAGLTADMGTWLESCIHCGMCAEACHFFIGTQDPKYTPIYKAELLKRVYRREVAPMRWVYRLVTREVTAQELEEWQELLYDSCTQCGRCSLLCPMGIHIQSMIQVSRNGLAAAGLAPAELQAVAGEQLARNSVFEAGEQKLKALVEKLRGQGVDIPLDKDQAEVMVLTSALDFLYDEKTLAATARIMNHIGVDWTLRSDGFESANFGALSGDKSAQRKISKRIIDAAKACGASKVIVAECGHAYPVLRWEAATGYGEGLPFQVMAVSEFMGEEVRGGRLRLKRPADGGAITYHDPCKIGRMGGSLGDARDVLAALGLELREMESHGRTNLCCGGGGGVYMLKRAERLRRAAFELKKQEVDATGAGTVITACSTCQQNLETGRNAVNWDKRVENLVQLVAENLAG